VVIDTEVTGNEILIIKLRGRMQLEDLHSLEGKFKQLISRHRAVIIDLSGLEALFSMGLRALIMSAQIVELRGGRLVLLAPGADVLAVLKASGTHMVIPICHNREEAESMVLKPATP
jgi:anti-anti-sigma factor